MYNYRPRAKQDWAPGQTVKVGFIADLEVLEKVATPGDYLPELYVLRSPKGTIYSFVPHNGLTRCESIEDARSH